MHVHQALGDVLTAVRQTATLTPAGHKFKLVAPSGLLHSQEVADLELLVHYWTPAEASSQGHLCRAQDESCVVAGVPIGQDSFVRAALHGVLDKHQVTYRQVAAMCIVQFGYLLLRYCLVVRFQFLNLASCALLPYALTSSACRLSRRFLFLISFLGPDAGWPTTQAWRFGSCLRCDLACPWFHFCWCSRPPPFLLVSDVLAPSLRLPCG